MKLLIVSTDQDLSLANLETAAQARNWQVVILNYHLTLEEIEAAIADQKFDWIYLRDPFNGLDFNLKHLTEATKLISNIQPQARFVDGARSMDDLLIEDKWLQYQELSQFMPETKLLETASELIAGENIAKQRISSRARGIAFNATQIEPDADYVLQPLLPIANEYRVYGVGQVIEPRASLRSSKTADSKVKVRSIETISPELLKYSQLVYAAVPQMDLVGFDIVELADGSYRLIEVNRSCQFGRYEELAGVSLAEKLLAHLENR